jgi:phosphatidylethanolamine/phosphatidyl-N-methylethanolamine N-methyltransferase
MRVEHVKAAYRRYAAVYDTVFGAALHAGRKAVIQTLNCRPGERVLEVGVGTGLSLPLYPADTRIVGIDLSREMLEKARTRVERLRLTNVEALEEMDAESMSFPDASFDKVVAMYVVSVVRHPKKLVSELERVCRPGGEILIVNHLRSENLVLGALEKSLAPLSSLIGFRPHCEMSELVDDVRRLEHVRDVNVLWKVLRLYPADNSRPKKAMGARADEHPDVLKHDAGVSGVVNDLHVAAARTDPVRFDR